MSGTLTASGLDRLALCPASGALPQVRHASSSDADRGTVKHAFLAAVPNIGVEAALELVPEKYREECSLIDLSNDTGLGRFIDSAKFLAEVAFAFDIVNGKGRVLGQNLGRDYSAAGPNEVVGTVDLVGLTFDEVVVPDVKTGHAYLEPSKMRQLKFLSLAASSAYGKTRAVSGVILLREDGSSYFKKVEFDEFDLSVFELELRDIVARVAEARAAFERGERLVTVEGDHCKYCPAFDSCPSQVGLVKQWAVAPESLGVSFEGCTEEELALAWERIQAFKRVLDRSEDALKLRARQRPIPLGNGQVLGESPVEEGVKSDVASAVLGSKYGLETARAAVETKAVITKSSIEKALRKHALKPPRKITELKDEAYEAIRAAKGYFVRVDVKKRKPTAEELAAAAGPLPDGTSTLQEMLAEGVRQNDEAKAKEAAQ